MVQILSAVASFHLQGVVHRDLKPEVTTISISSSNMYVSFTIDALSYFWDYRSQNFLFVSKNEKSPIKAIDFGLSDFVNPGWFLVENYVSHSFLVTHDWRNRCRWEAKRHRWKCILRCSRSSAQILWHWSRHVEYRRDCIHSSMREPPFLGPNGVRHISSCVESKAQFRRRALAFSVSWSCRLHQEIAGQGLSEETDCFTGPK